MRDLPIHNESENYLDALLEGCQVIDPQWRYVYVNDAVVKQSKSTREALLGHTMMEVFPGIDQTPLFAVLTDAMLHKTHHQIENQFTFPDGSKGWFELLVRPIPAGIFIFSMDITARKLAEASLQASEQKYKNLVEQMDDIVFSLDPFGNVTYINPSIERLYNIPSALILNRSLRAIAHPDDAKRLSEYLVLCLSGAPQAPLEFRAFFAQNRWRHLRLRCRYHADDPQNPLCGLLTDFTEHRRTEEQLRLSQKLEAVGQLAGGIAHDFNNLLSVILNYTAFSLNALPPAHPSHPDLLEVQKAGQRAASLTRQLLAFSRKQVLSPEILNMNSVLQNMKDMLQRLLGEHIQVIFHPSPVLWNVKADPSQIEQVVMNLSVNARDAMPDGGKLTIETINIDFSHVGDYLNPPFAPLKPDQYVCTSFSDSGVGIPKDIIEHIFEPFFTTKEQGKGTGLGLSTVYGIIQQSGGHITVYSEPNNGTSFKVYLPRCHLPSQSAPVQSLMMIPQGHETILVAEDEDAVRRLTERILVAAGYRVIACKNAQEALDAAQKHRDAPPDLLLTDVVMPGINGKKLADLLLVTCPGLKVLYMSGYADHAILENKILDPHTHFISKPFSALELTQKIRFILDPPETEP